MQINPLEWNGKDFLTLYITLLITLTIVGIFLRWFLRFPLADQMTAQDKPETLDAYEAAYLAGGPARAVDAAVGKLYQSGHLVAQSSGRLAAGDTNLDGAPEIEQRVLAAAGSGRPLTHIRSSAGEAAREVGSSLKEAGLTPDAGGALARITPFVLMALLTIFGIIKIAIGIERGKNVGFIVILTIIAFFISLLFVFRPVIRSRKGDAALKRLRSDNAALKHVATRHGETVAPTDLSYAVALFGLGALAAPAYADLRRCMTPAPQSGDGGSSCSSGGSSCGSSCGGGGGGGGCGGCSS